jgi:hypothetical protein
MLHADHTINSFGAVFIGSSNGSRLPSMRDDGTYEVRLNANVSLATVKMVLTEHEGLEIVSEQIND